MSKKIIIHEKIFIVDILDLIDEEVRCQLSDGMIDEDWDDYTRSDIDIVEMSQHKEKLYIKIRLKVEKFFPKLTPIKVREKEVIR